MADDGGGERQGQQSLHRGLPPSGNGNGSLSGQPEGELKTPGRSVIWQASLEVRSRFPLMKCPEANGSISLPAGTSGELTSSRHTVTYPPAPSTDSLPSLSVPTTLYRPDVTPVLPSA